jgi:hypothetical protein
MGNWGTKVMNFNFRITCSVFGAVCHPRAWCSQGVGAQMCMSLECHYYYCLLLLLLLYERFKGRTTTINKVILDNKCQKGNSEKNVFRWKQDVLRLVADMMCLDKLFQTTAPVTGKARLPMVYSL